MRRLLSVLSLTSFMASSAAAEPLTLDQAVEAALLRSRGVIHARTDVLLADVEAMRALSFILPSFDLQFSATEQFAGTPVVEQRSTQDIGVPVDLTRPIPTGPYRDFTLGNSSAPQFGLTLSGRQLIYDGGRWWLLIERAGDLQAAQKAALAAVENDTRLAVARRFWELEKALRSAQTFANQIDVDLAQLERVKALLAAGLGRTNDVAQVERNLAEDRIQLERRQNAARGLRRQLNLAMGRAADTAIELTVVENDPLSMSVPSLPELVKHAVGRRPELARTKAQLESLQKDVGIARADYYPVINLAAQYRRSSRRPDRVFDDPTQNYYAGVGLELRWNMFNGRATTAAVENAELQLTKVEATFEEEQRVVAADVEDRLDAASLAIRVYELAMQAIAAAEEAVRLARGLYTEGRGTLLELRDAELRLTLQKLSAIEARIDLEIAREELRRAVGEEVSWPKKPG